MIGIRLSSAIRLDYLQHLFGQSIHVLDSMPPGYATTTITSTANVLQLGISEKLGTFVEFNSTIIAAIVVAFTKNWSLTLVTASVILFLFLVLGTILPFILKVNAKITKARLSSPPSRTFLTWTRLKVEQTPLLAKLLLVFAWWPHVVPSPESPRNTPNMSRRRRRTESFCHLWLEPSSLSS